MNPKYKIKFEKLQMAGFEKDDCRLIIDVLKKNECKCDMVQAYSLWKRVSESVCAGWLILPPEKDLFKYLLPYLEEIK